MNIADFCLFHEPSLMSSEIRHNLIIAQLGRIKSDPTIEVKYWTLGEAGHCALRMPGKPIILGEVTEDECAKLAEYCRDEDYTGVVGPDQKPLWFAARAADFGHTFADPVPQRIYSLRSSPIYPAVSGSARMATIEDLNLLMDWLADFIREATFDAPPQRHQIAAMIAEQRHSIWTVDGTPMSVAAINRRTPNSAAIGSVYTPPRHRQRGFAGAVTAAVVDRIYAEGRTSACLYTDLRNPYSNRCYTKIGFQPECDAMHLRSAVSNER